MESAHIRLSNPNPRTQQNLSVFSGSSSSGFSAIPIEQILSYTSKGSSVTVELEGRRVAQLSFEPGVTEQQVEEAFKSWLPPAAPSFPKQTFPTFKPASERSDKKGTPFKTLSLLLLLPTVIALLYWQRDKIQAWLPER